MINKHIRLLFAGILLVFSVSIAKASQFNGVIYFLKIDGTDTSLYKYYVKDQYIRVEDINKDGNVNGIMLINTEQKNIVLLSSVKKIYINVPISNTKRTKLNLDINKTTEKMNIAGKECFLWISIDKKTMNRYEFWIHKNGYSFFNEMLQLLNREEPIANVWLSMNVGNEYFPFVGSTYSSTGDLISKIEIVNIIEEDLPVEMFIKPDDYQIMRREQ